MFQLPLAHRSPGRDLHSLPRVPLSAHAALNTPRHGDCYHAHTRLKTLAASSVPPQRPQMGPLMHFVDGRELDHKVWPIIKEMLRHVWPKDQPALKARVVAAVGLLLGSKVSKCDANDTHMYARTHKHHTCAHTCTHAHVLMQPTLKPLHIKGLHFIMFPVLLHLLIFISFSSTSTLSPPSPPLPSPPLLSLLHSYSMCKFLSSLSLL